MIFSLINLQRALLASWLQEAIHVVGRSPSNMNAVTRTQSTVCAAVLEA
nr:hypothetical protein [uncultured Rhodoferax sp.]